MKRTVVHRTHNVEGGAVGPPTPDLDRSLGSSQRSVATDQRGGGGVDQPPFLNAYLDGPRVVAVARGPQGVVLKPFEAEYSCFLREADLRRDVRRALQSASAVRSMTREPGGWVRVRWADADCRREACIDYALPGGGFDRCWFSKLGIKTYEADVSPVRRWATDRRIAIARPRRAYLDLEADSRVPYAQRHNARIVIWAVTDEAGETTTGVLDEETDISERALLRLLVGHLQRFDQVAAWGGDFYDFPLLAARLHALGVRFDGRRFLWIDHCELFRRMNQMAAESGEEKQSMKLDDVSQAVLGYGKEEGVTGEMAYHLWASCGAQRERARLYCAKDSRLMRDLEERTGYLALHQVICETCFVFPDSAGIQPQRQVGGYLYRLAAERNAHFVTRASRVKLGDGDDDAFRGAFVLDPTRKGILKDVHVVDFAGMYPSIIQSWNMSPDTKYSEPDDPEIYEGLEPDEIERLRGTAFILRHARGKPERPAGTCEAPRTGVYFRTDERGILVEAIDQLVEARAAAMARKASLPPGTDAWKEADREASARKITNNSFFGVVGSKGSPFYDREVAESVSQAGVFLLTETIKFAEGRGFRTLYGDTDSLFFSGIGREQVKAFVKACNEELYPRLLAELGCPRNEVKLAYEKEFRRLVFVSAKRYVGYWRHYKGVEAPDDARPEIKGIELKRGDSTRLAREVQREIIEVLRDGDDPAAYVALAERWVRRVLEGDLTRDDVVVSKRLNQPLKAYKVPKKKDGTAGKAMPFIEVAKELQRRGRDVSEGVKIDYYVAPGPDGRVYKPAEDWDGNVDRYDLWESAVWPGASRLLAAAFPAELWERFSRVRPRRVSPKQARLGFDVLGLLPPGEDPKHQRRAAKSGALRQVDALAVATPARQVELLSTAPPRAKRPGA